MIPQNTFKQFQKSAPFWPITTQQQSNNMYYYFSMGQNAYLNVQL